MVCFTGDGGLMMVAAELETVARLRLPIVIVVFDDQALSLIDVKQEQRGLAGTSMRYAGPDLAALARAFGIRAWSRRTRRRSATRSSPRRPRAAPR